MSVSPRPRAPAGNTATGWLKVLALVFMIGMDLRLSLVALSMLLSYACARLPVVSGLSSGTRIILLTVLIAAGAALLRPVKAPERDPNFEGGGGQ